VTAAPPPARLVLVRHGETEWNVERRYQGHRDSPLTERGHWQTRQVATRLARTPIAAVYASDLPRTMTTAAPIAAAHGQSVTSAPAMREANFGAYEGCTFAELVEQHGEIVQRWWHDPLTLAPPGGETLVDVQTRVAGFLGQLAARHAGETVIIVGHGGSVRAAVIDVLQMDARRFRSLRTDNGGLTVIECAVDHATLVLFNDITHLLPNAVLAP
jgi:alpha-ribazole phosphatase